MKPVAIFRHSPTEGPGYFATYLDRHSIPWTLIRIDAGEAVPAMANVYSGLVLMGGPMSVNDKLPWIPKVLELIDSAVRKDIPVLGHCLGGQLMSRALGGSVGPNQVKEIGWGRVCVADNEQGRAWFGATREFLAFHWHGETFTIPPGATCIASSPHCPAQAFTLKRHLGMQFHVEMVPEMIHTWCESGKDELARWSGPTVQEAGEMQQHLQPRIQTLNQMADRLYGRWIEGIER